MELKRTISDEIKNKKVNTKIVKPLDYKSPKKIEIGSEEMIQIWKNIEACFSFAGFNRWGFADELGVRRQTLDNWIRTGSVPSVQVFMNISRIFDLPISTLLDTEKSCLEAYKNIKRANISYLSKKLTDITVEESMMINHFSKLYNNNKDFHLLMVPKNIFVEKVVAKNLFWLYMNSINTSFEAYKKTDVVIVYRKDFYFENGIYLIKENNETKIVYIKFKPKNGKISICYNDYKQEEYSLDDNENFIILGKIVKKITS